MLKSLAAGALAGLASTLIMSPVMAPRVTRAAARRLPGVHALDEFPPRRVVQAADEQLTGTQSVPDEVQTALTVPAHLVYGTTMGAIYGVVRSWSHVERRMQMSGAGAGVLFGLAVWASGYAGWLPVLGVREGTIRADPRDMAFPLIAHIVYGASTGALHERMRSVAGSRQ